MTTAPRAATLVALLVGAFMAVEGIWGLASSSLVFGVLTINRTRAVIHLVLGVGALLASRKCPVGYLIFLGVIINLVALLWGIPATRNFISHLLAVNQGGAMLDTLIGPICLVTAYTSRRYLAFNA